MRLSLSPVWICLLAVAVAGCGSSTTGVSDPSNGDFGHFEGEVVAAWDSDGRRMTLREEFAYIDAQNRRWVAPVGSVVDGASIPSVFWTVIGAPFEGKYRNASVVHDIGCSEMRQPWEDVHQMFYEACRCGGVDETQAKIIYYAVYHFGPRWQNVVEPESDTSGQVAEQEVAVQHVARIDPPPPTPDELEQVKAFIAEENPEPAAIERFNRDSLHRRPRRGHSGSASRSEAGGSPPHGRPEFANRQNRPDGGQSGHPILQNPQGENRQGRQLPGRRIEASASPIGQEEQQWATEIVRRYLEQQAGEQRLAEYSVERARGGYRVLVQFLHEDAQGQMVPYPGGTCSARISRDGRVLEVVSGFATTNVANTDQSINNRQAVLPVAVREVK